MIHNDGREALTKLSARQKEAALRRAIIRVKPEYYSWSPEAQERYRVTMPEEDLFRINRALLQALGIRVCAVQRAARTIGTTRNSAMNAEGGSRPGAARAEG